MFFNKLAWRCDIVEPWLREKLEEALNRPEEINMNVTPFIEQGRTQRTQEIVEMLREMKVHEDGTPVNHVSIDDLLSRITEK